MTSFEPTIIVKSLLVLRGSEVVYQANFHLGVNILAGENSSGKSTVLSFLVYGLGADVSDWSEHAQKCDRVMVEVSVNGQPAVFSRFIEARSMQPMDIFPGEISQALGAPSTAWQRFPYRSSTEKISFSQQIFGMLALPELQTEVSGKITMHQLLRLHYADQMSSIEHIFRDEAFDSPDLRDAIGRFLFGAYDNEIYKNKLLLRDLKSRLESINASLKSIYAVLPHDTPLTLNWVFNYHRLLTEKIEKIRSNIDEIESSVDPEGSNVSLVPLQQALSKLKVSQAQLSEIDQKLEALELEFADSELFISSISDKIQSIEDSSAVSSEIDEVRYTHCPSCYASLSEIQMQSACHLCQQPFDQGRLQARMLRQLASIRLQLRQSKALQHDRENEIRNAKSLREKLLSEWRVASENVDRLQSQPTSLVRNQIRLLYEELGGLQQEQKTLSDRATLIEKLDQMSAESKDTSAEMATIEDTNRRLIAAEEDRLKIGKTSIADQVLWFLRHDLPRQDTFQDAKSLNFSFEKDSISVNGIEYFSASSKVYLKNAFIVGFLFAAVQQPAFRHLRFAILDTIEDKGIEPERSQNFQRLLVEKSLNSKIDHQIIFATAMIDPSLDDDKFVVGRKSTHSDRTLKILG